MEKTRGCEDFEIIKASEWWNAVPSLEISSRWWAALEMLDVAKALGEL